MHWQLVVEGLDFYRQIVYNYTMIHKISDLCKKIDGLKAMSDKLYRLKYNNPKTPERDAEVNHLVEDIQATCRLIAGDNKPYEVKAEYDPSGLPKDFTDKYQI